MKAVFTSGLLLLSLFHLSTSDIYLHWPPGSNNRFNGNRANVRNARRLFDSQVGLNLTLFALYFYLTTVTVEL